MQIFIPGFTLIRIYRPRRLARSIRTTMAYPFVTVYAYTLIYSPIPLSNVSMTFSVHLRQAYTDSIAVFLSVISPHQFKNLKTISYAHITHIKILVKFNVFSNIINLKSKNVNMLIFLSFKITEKIVLNLKACPRKKPSAWCGGSSINKNR